MPNNIIFKTSNVSGALPANLREGELAVNAVDRVGWSADAGGNVFELFRPIQVTATEPTAPSAGTLWMDTGNDPAVLKQWDGAAWVDLLAGVPPLAIDDPGPIGDFGDQQALCPGGIQQSGAWVNATPYTMCQTVQHSGYVLRPLQAHTSGPVSEPFTGADWRQFWQVVWGAPMGFVFQVNFFPKIITLPFINATGTVNWGDGSPLETFTNADHISHRYAGGGAIYTMEFTGTIEKITSAGMGSGGTTGAVSSDNYYNCLIGVSQLGDLGVTSFERAFEDCYLLATFNTAGIKSSSIQTMKGIAQIVGAPVAGQSALQNLYMAQWDISGLVGTDALADLFKGHTMPVMTTAMYDQVLQNFAEQALAHNIVNMVRVDFGPTRYSRAPSPGAAARAVLTSPPLNWQIIDGGPI